MAAPSTIAPSAGQVRIRLFTRQPDLELSGIGPILVSTKPRENANGQSVIEISRLDVSKLVNQLLEREKPVPLEVLINGIFLRTSIDNFLTQHGISAETTLPVEYTRSLVPPTYQTSFEHDDWVGAVDVLSPTSPSAGSDPINSSSSSTCILTGSFDGLLRLWSPSGHVTATSSLCSPIAPVQSIYSAKFLSSNRIISSGLGVPIRIWSYKPINDQPDEDLPVPNAQGTLIPELDLYGHKAASNCLAIHGPSSRILSASNDGTIALFSSSPASELSPLQPTPPEFLPPTLSSSKRRKLSHSSPEIPTAGPLSILSSHTAPSTAVIFHPQDSTAAYSASRDRTLLTWDLVTSKAVSSRTPSPGNQLTSLAPMKSLGLIAVGTVSRTINLVDPRADSKTGRSSVMTLSGFKLPVSCLAPDPTRDYSIAGGSHDGTVRVFDVRGVSGTATSMGVDDTSLGGRITREAYKITRRSDIKCEKKLGGQGVKVLSLAWDQTIGLCSAGEDRMVQVDRVEGEM